VITYNALIGACEEAQQPQQVFKVFEAMLRQGLAPTLITYSALISACEKVKHAERAVEAFEAMQREGLLPDCI